MVLGRIGTSGWQRVKQFATSAYSSGMVRAEGLELPRLALLDFKSRATRPALDHDSLEEVMLKQSDSGTALAPSEPPLL